MGTANSGYTFETGNTLIQHAVPSASATDVKMCRHRCPAPLYFVGQGPTGGIASTPRPRRGSSDVENYPGPRVGRRWVVFEGSPGFDVV